MTITGELDVRLSEATEPLDWTTTSGSIPAQVFPKEFHVGDQVIGGAGAQIDCGIARAARPARYYGLCSPDSNLA